MPVLDKPIKFTHYQPVSEFKSSSSELLENGDHAIKANLVKLGHTNLNGFYVAEGALDDWMAENPSRTIDMNWFHRQHEIFGDWLVSVDKSDENLYAGDGTVYDGFQRGDEALQLIDRGRVTGVSVEGWIIEGERDKELDAFRVDKLDLTGAALVKNPADVHGQIQQMVSQLAELKAEPLEEDLSMGAEDKTIDKKEIVSIVEDEVTPKLDEIKSSTDELKSSLEEANEELKSDLETKMDALNQSVDELNKKVVQTRFITPRDDEMWVKSEDQSGVSEMRIDMGRRVARPRIMRSAITTYDNTIGHEIGQAPVWHETRNINEFRDVNMRVTTIGQASVQLPRAGLNPWAAEASVTDNPSRGGSLVNKTITSEMQSNENAFTRSSFDDVPGLREDVATQYVELWAEREADMCLAAVKASIAAATDFDVKTVKTGETGADTVPLTAGNALARLNSMIGSVLPKYHRGSAFMIGGWLQELLFNVTDSANGPLTFDPTLGLFTIRGFPVILSSVLVAGTDTLAANDILGIFGNFNKGMRLSMHGNLTIQESTENKLGSYVYRGEARATVDVFEGQGMAALIQKAP